MTHGYQTAPLILLVTLGGLLAAPGTGEVLPALGGPLRTYCADGIAPHSKRVKLSTVIADDRLESSESVLLAAFYGPHPSTQGTRGSVRAKATLIKLDGSRQALRTLKGKQEAANAPLLLTKPVSTSLQEGDVVFWDIKLRGFSDLAGGCFNIGALVGPHE